MIKMQDPSLAINSHDVPGPNYKMWRTLNSPKGMTAEEAVHFIIRVNRLALEFEGTQVQNVVINCHGLDGGGRLYVGGLGYIGIDIDTVGSFSLLKGRNLGTIWLVACQAAAGADGKQLCQALATNSGCQVVASDDDQDTGIWGSFRIVTAADGLIDEFEGTVFSFAPMGGIRAIDPHEAIYTILE